MILSIDTATRYAGIALYDGQAVIAEQSWRSNVNHTVELLPNIMRALEQQELQVRDLAGLVVAIGPGSFTGLRIGLSVAKGMASVTGKPLLGVPTLDVLGYACARADIPTCAIIEAGRSRYCTATYQLDGQALRRLDDYAILSTDELLSNIQAPTQFCGELSPALRERIKKELADKAQLLGPAASLRRPGYLAELGWQRLQQGDRDNPATLSPMYLYEPIAGASA